MHDKVGKGVARRQITKLSLGSAPAQVEDSLAVEEPLEIRVSDDTLAVTMRTPGDDERLAVGFLFAEGLIASRDDLSSISHCGRPGTPEYGDTINAIPAPGLSLDVDRVSATRRGTLTTSACGVCGRKSVDDVRERCPVVPAGPVVPAKLLVDAQEAMRSRQRNFDRTGGLHAAAILDAHGTILAHYEDVGRHNAVDKAVGSLVLSGALPRKGRAGEPGVPVLLAVSGRSSFEIVQKAATAGLPVVCSVSAASSLAADLADATGVTLCGFVRGGSLNVYTHPERIAP